MRRFVVTAIWTAVSGFASLVVGASAFGIIAYALNDPGRRPATWAGWDWLFYGFAVGLPVATMVLTICLGAMRKLPGTAPSSERHGDPDSHPPPPLK